MTTLHDRLADLADAAPPGGPDPDLWDRGRRYHRRRRIGTAAIAAAVVVLLALVAGVSWQRSTPAPMPAGGPVGLPDRLWTPSPWLPVVERPGQLVAVTSAERGRWTGMGPGLVGVSATSGDYAFLDLPDVDLEHGEVALAPDGRHLAYWLTGPTTDTPNSESGPITGVAVLDTGTGAVARHEIATEHGLMPDFLAWSDAATVVSSAGQIRGGDDDSEMDQSSSSFGRAMVWSLGERPRPIAGLDPGADLEGAAHGWILVGQIKRRGGHLLVDPSAPATARSIDVPQLAGAIGSLDFVAVGPSDDRIALVAGNQTPGWAKAGPAGSLAEVPGSERTLGVLAWVDEDTIVTLGFAGRGWNRSGLYLTSVSTGERQEIVRFPNGQTIGGWTFATDLLVAPSVEGQRPPTPLDPRVTLGLSIIVVIGGLLALLWWRRRVQP